MTLQKWKMYCRVYSTKTSVLRRFYNEEYRDVKNRKISEKQPTTSSQEAEKQAHN